MKKRLLVCFLGVLVFTACQNKNRESAEIAKEENHDNFKTREDKQEADFVVEAVAKNYANIRFAQLAMNKSANSDIREVAALIEKDQAEELRRFTGLANKKGIAVPLEETKDARNKLNELANHEKREFNEKWCQNLAKRNEREIQSFESMWEKTHDKDLKELINASLPEMRNHLVKLRSCQEKLAMN
jgi:putative membrane protein